MENYSTEQLRDILEQRSLLGEAGREIVKASKNTETPALGFPEQAPELSGGEDFLIEFSSHKIFNEIRTRQKALYGEDDRQEVHETANSQRRANAKSVAAIFKVSDLTATEPSKSAVASVSLADKFRIKGTPLCKREPFQAQPSSAIGTAFLVAPTIVVTAAHCINAENFGDFRLVFDFELSVDGSVETVFDVERIYSVRKHLGGGLDTGLADWSIVELDRPVSGCTPLVFRRDDKIQDDTPVYVIGHPSGLPKKVAGNAQVRINSDPSFFVANLDTYGGNSGSPVFNALSHEVEGILVRGKTDFAPLGDCVASLVCPIGGCRGEDCTRMDPIVQYFESIA